MEKNVCHNRQSGINLIIFLSKNLKSFFPFIIGLKNPFSPVYNTDTVHSIIVCFFFCTYWLYKYIVVYVIKSGVYKTELGKKVPKIIKEIDLVVNQHTRQTTTYKYLTTNLCFVPVPFVVYYYYYALVLVVPIITCFHQAQAGRSR